MSQARHPQLGHRPDYFVSFDRWLQQLEAHILDPATRASLLTTLDEDGRQIDVQQLAGRHHLSRAAVGLVRRLVRFGDVGHPLHTFASICIAEVAPTARSQSVTTYVYATRRGTKVDYWWADTAEGFGALGMRNQPLTLREAVAMVERVVRAQARYDVVDGGDRAAYMAERAAQLRISSRFYPQIAAALRARRQRGRRPSSPRRRPK